MSARASSYARRQHALVELLQEKGIYSRAVLDAIGRVPRELFVQPDLRALAWSDQPLPIGYGQTISQPYIVALMTQALELTGRESVLEIGAGSGYQAAVLGELARSVVSIERVPELAARAARLLAQLGCENITVIEGDGNLGWPPQAPYDRIIVTAATGACPPALFDQLREGGLLVIPLGPPGLQALTQIRKVAGRPASRQLCDCAFVPLIDGESPRE